MKIKITSIAILFALLGALLPAGLFVSANSNPAFNNLYEILRPDSSINVSGPLSYSGANYPFWHDYINDNNDSTYLTANGSGNYTLAFGFKNPAYADVSLNSLNVTIRIKTGSSGTTHSSINFTILYRGVPYIYYSGISRDTTFGAFSTTVYNATSSSIRFTSDNFTVNDLRDLSAVVSAYWDGVDTFQPKISEVFLDANYNVNEQAPGVTVKQPVQYNDNSVYFTLTTSGNASDPVNYAGLYLEDITAGNNYQSYTEYGNYAPNSSFNFSFSNLTPGNTYRYTGWALNNAGIGSSNASTFIMSSLSGNVTIAANLTINVQPMVITNSLESLTATTAKFSGKVLGTNLPLTYNGFEWWLTGNYSTAQNRTWINTGGNGTQLSWLESSLTSNTSYTYRYFAKNTYGIGYGQNYTFTTYTGIPDVVLYTELPGNNPTSRIFQVGITDMHGDRINVLGINLTSAADNKTWYAPFGSVGTFNITVNDLLVNNTYNVTAFARGENGTGLSATRSFTTLSATVPTMSTGTANKTGTWTFLFNGEIVATNGAVITERGFEYTWIKGNYNAGFKNGITALSGYKLIHGNFVAGTFNLTIGAVDIPSGYTTLWYHSVAISNQGKSIGGEMYFDISDNSTGGDTGNNTGNTITVVNPVIVTPPSGGGATPKEYISQLIGDDAGTWWLVMLICMVGAFGVAYASPTFRVILPVFVCCLFIAINPQVFGWLVILGAVIAGWIGFKKFNGEAAT